jgi:sulfhydrogenase subunit gamma (sulfur reductase)
MQNIYLPQQIKILKIEKMSADVKRFRLASPKLKGKGGLAFIPAQFMLIGVWGHGESPFGISSSPYEKKFIEISVRNTGGDVTSALHGLKEGDYVTLRGPFGNGFPLDFFEGKDLVMATGGCGIPPIAALINHVIKNRKKFGKVYLLYGAKTPGDILMKEDLKAWGESINVILTIDKPFPGWTGHVGFVTDIVKDIDINPETTVATMCGPGPMMNALEKILRPLGIPDRRIFVSMERKMQCGVGKCQHCTCGEKYVCLDGPVFNFDEVDKNWD